MLSAMDPFPVLRITKDDLVPEGTFAESQAAFLKPDASVVSELDALLREKKIGVVAHFYMDPELQGVLAACEWPHIGVSDSLKMADRGIEMVEAGCEAIVVLGVDFMSENARAMLDAAGHADVPVYRVAIDEIGCSLAESAEKKAYGAYLTEASQTPHALHVVYINTSLITKAKAHALVPTITCTSSNVVQTILQAGAQVDDVSIFFGPDTYMGHNLESMLRAYEGMSDAQVRELHPAYGAAEIRALRERFHTFEQGNCVVHHMFGADVVDRVKHHHEDAFVTAHLEVPGEMFAMALDYQNEGRGVVGSTSNILAFILGKVREVIESDGDEKLQFVLGTEAGMITPIVRQVQQILAEAGTERSVDILFPVASEAVAQTADASLPIVPGVAAGEGCTTAGGCATCPYMKMNSLDALVELCRKVGVESPAALEPYEPKKYQERIHGRTAADLGGEPILHMRHFQQTGELPKALVDDIQSRPGKGERAHP
jgi:quinolinate synthase